DSVFNRFDAARLMAHPDNAHTNSPHYDASDPHIHTAYKSFPVALASRSTFAEPSEHPDPDVHNDQNAQTAHHGFFHVQSHQYVSTIVTKSVPFQHDKTGIIDGVDIEHPHQPK